MADLTRTIGIVFEATNNAGPAMDGLNKSLTSIGGSASSAADLWQDAAGRWRNSAGQFATEAEKAAAGAEKIGASGQRLNELTLAFKALAAAVVIKEFIDANVEAEKFERAMTLLKGSTRAAGVEFDYIKGLANRLGLELFSTADAYVSLTAATKGTALEGRATRDIFEAVSSSMSLLGKSSDDTKGALLAIGQMVSKGTVSMEELRGQLGERLPGAFQTAAKAMGTTTKGLDDLVSSGKLTAEEFLPKFAKALRETFGSTDDIEGYQAAWNRLQNALKESFIQIGQTGVMDVLTKGVQAATASVVGAVAGFTLLGEVIGAVAGAIATGHFSGLGDAIDAAMTKAADKTRAASEAMLTFKSTSKDTEEAAGKVGTAVAAGMGQAALSASEAEKASKALVASLKEIGVNPDKVIDPLIHITKAFTDLATNPVVKGDQIMAGLFVTLDKLKASDSVKGIQDALVKAFESGKLTAHEFATALETVDLKTQGLWGAQQKAAAAALQHKDSLEKTAKAAEEAKQKSDEYRLKLEEIASNERIKVIEARVNLNIAQLQADAEKVKAIFASLDNTVGSTGDLLGKLFDKLGSNLETLDKVDLKNQIELENKRRQEALDLQKELTRATIDEIRARTRAMEGGDALIKINGDGLAPHLEAFMWEILKQVQTRVNRDGLGMLLGM